MSYEDFQDEDGNWKCIKCGACCLVLMQFLPPEVQAELDRGDGRCKHLTEDNACAIYETRPDPWCRVPDYTKGLFMIAQCDLMYTQLKEGGSPKDFEAVKQGDLTFLQVKRGRKK